MVDSKEEQKPEEGSQGSFLSGAGISLLLGLTMVFIGINYQIFSGWFWNIMIIAFGLPVAAVSLALIWARSGKGSMVSGAIMIFIIGLIVALGVIIWFVTLLNSLGH